MVEVRFFPYLKCKVVGIAVMDALLHSLDADDGDDRAKGLLPRNPHIWGHVVNEKWVDQVVLPLPLLHITSAQP